MKYNKILKKINILSGIMRQKDDLDLKKLSTDLQRKINYGYSEVEILIEAFALVREVDFRAIGLYPTDEQVYAAIALYHGNVADMKTGEGKSLAATMPLYLKALYKGTVFLVTTNDYLASRDYQRIGKVYRWLGLQVADGSADPDAEEFDIIKRKKIYSANIIYISNSTFGFDYLIDGLAEGKEKRFIPELTYAILDEVDEILLDSAQMPLIISGAPKIQSNYFGISNAFVRTLRKNLDYKLDEEGKNVWLSELGVEKAKKYFSIHRLLSKEHFFLYQHIILALKAQHILKKDRDYIVESGKIKLLDRKDGRVLEGSNLQSGLHQAIQSKEGVELTPETQVISSITYQNLFRQFQQLAGMSGTAKVAENEFITTYNLPVKRVETSKKNIRRDHKPQQYATFDAKLKASLDLIQKIYQKGRPLLIITGSVDASELFSTYLLNMGIPHNLLNAKSSIKEAQIINEAGKVGSVTVSTSMAGRGTDIKLTPESIKRGGLAVVVTERLINKRIEMQAKGRAGRQGEPGDTYSFESLEDEVLKQFLHESIQSYYDRHKASFKSIRNLRIKHYFNKAQKKSEERAYNGRLSSLQFDEILRIQKSKVDKSREKIITATKISELLSIIKRTSLKTIEFYFEQGNLSSEKEIYRFILDYIDYNFENQETLFSLNSREEVLKYFETLLMINLKKKRKTLNDDVVFLQYLKMSILKSIDISWSKQIDALNQLRFVVQSRTSAQKKTIIEYEKEAQKSYEIFIQELNLAILRNTALSLFEIRKDKLIVTFP